MLNLDEKIKRAKTWGKAHGYYGIGFGWICHPSRQDTVARSWEALYNRHATRIEYWFTHREGFASGDLVWYHPGSYYPQGGGQRLAAEIVEFTTKRVRIKVEKDQGQVPQIITRVVSLKRLKGRLPLVRSMS